MEGHPIPASKQRRRYTADFKSGLIAACCEPGGFGRCSGPCPSVGSQPAPSLVEEQSHERHVANPKQ